MHLISDADLERYLAEDVPYGDLTTRSLGIGAKPARMEFRAGADMTVCCGEEAARMLTRLGCGVDLKASSGVVRAKGATLLEVWGSAEAVLAGWKISQTLMEYASGIATAAARIVAAAREVDPDVTVACTRKTFPGTRAVAIKAIVAGGAVPHRLGLSDTLLVFPEHRSLLSGTSLAEMVAELRLRCPEKKVVMEVNSPQTALEAARAGIDVVQLEKFPPAQVAETVALLDGLPTRLAAAGGVNAGNAADYVRAGARILVSSAPYWAKPADVKVTIGPG